MAFFLFFWCFVVCFDIMNYSFEAVSFSSFSFLCRFYFRVVILKSHCVEKPWHLFFFFFLPLMVFELRMSLICIFMLLAGLHDQGVDLSWCNQHMNKEKQARGDYGVTKMTLHQLLMWGIKNLLVYNYAPKTRSSFASTKFWGQGGKRLVTVRTQVQPCNSDHVDQKNTELQWAVVD